MKEKTRTGEHLRKNFGATPFLKSERAIFETHLSKLRTAFTKQCFKVQRLSNIHGILSKRTTTIGRLAISNFSKILAEFFRYKLVYS